LKQNIQVWGGRERGKGGSWVASGKGSRFNPSSTKNCGKKGGKSFTIQQGKCSGAGDVVRGGGVRQSWKSLSQEFHDLPQATGQRKGGRIVHRIKLGKEKGKHNIGVAYLLRGEEGREVGNSRSNRIHGKTATTYFRVQDLGLTNKRGKEKKTNSALGGEETSKRVRYDDVGGETVLNVFGEASPFY